MAAAVEVTGLSKRYGDTVAVDGIDLDVRTGTIVAVVGPNGAGKTTAVECIEGLRRPDAGSLRVLGLDPVRDRKRLVQRLGVQLQDGSLYEKTRVDEAFWVSEPFYERTRPRAELIETFGLQGKERAYYDTLSGGQKMRLLTALAFVGDPDLAILDEPTSGLDPQARRNVWRALREGADERGGTVLLTTHNLDEAHDECDEVVIIDGGRVIARGAPAALLAEHGIEQRVSIEVSPEDDLTVEHCRELLGAVHAENDRGRLVAFGRERELTARAHSLLADVARRAAARGAPPPAFEMRAARLHDLFLILTGREYREG
jgi:ABC-2 type transport system ATP-binding protein